MDPIEALLERLRIPDPWEMEAILRAQQRRQRQLSRREPIIDPDDWIEALSRLSPRR